MGCLGGLQTLTMFEETFFHCVTILNDNCYEIRHVTEIFTQNIYVKLSNENNGIMKVGHMKF